MSLLGEVFTTVVESIFYTFYRYNEINGEAKRKKQILSGEVKEAEYTEVNLSEQTRQSGLISDRID